MACITPFCKDDKALGIRITVPCGKCPHCLKRRASGWAFRLQQQGKIAWSAMFITLTLDTKHVQITKNGFMTLDKKDLQNFFKRLRYAFEDAEDHPPLKYYAVGEYGGHYKRPHYHIILFNATPASVHAAWRFPPRDGSTKEATDAGAIYYGTVSGASIGYTLKYMCKEKTIPMHRNDDRLPEFSLMSKGLGANYITEAMTRYHKGDLENRMNCVLPDGKIIAMPRYYKDKIYTEKERKIIAWHAIKANLEREAEEYKKNVDKYGEYEYLRLKAEADILSFKNMYSNATKNRDKAGSDPTV